MTAPSMGTGLKPALTLTPDDVIARCVEAVEVARVFFGVSNEWRVWIEPGDGKGGSAALLLNHAYLKATLNVNVDHFMTFPEEIWGAMGHEVAHMITAELNQLWGQMPVEWREDGQVPCDLLRAAFEQATVRLERLFVRCCPDPHAQAQAGAA